MKKILFLILFLILVSSCANKEPKVVYRYIEKPVYIQCQKPTIPQKPEFTPYKIFRVQLEGKYYYCADIDNAKIISENWLKYKNWCESLEEVLKNDK